MLKFIFILFSFAQSGKSDTFKTLHLTDAGYYLNTSKTAIPLNCNAYQNKKDEGIKARFSINDKEFALECKGQEVGTSYNLIVNRDAKLISQIEGIVSSGGDCGMSYQTQAWIHDVNSDGHMDVIQRSKFHDGPSDCGGQKEVRNEDTLTVQHWNISTQSFQKITPDEKTLKQYKKQYDFKL